MEPDRETPAGGSVIPPESYYSVFEFMSSDRGLALKGVELGVYALVYSYSNAGGGACYGSNATTAHRVGCTERHVSDVLGSLESRGLIRMVGWHKRGSSRTKMWEADMPAAISACESCRGGGPSGGAARRAGPGVENPARPEGSSVPDGRAGGVAPNSVRERPELSSANKTGIKNVDYEGGDGLERAFAGLVRAYPFCGDRDAALRAFAPLFERGVRAEHVSRVLGEWARRHPGRDDKPPFYPDLAAFLDESNPEGYASLARAMSCRADAEQRRRVRELTRDVDSAEVYELFTADGLDGRAAELYQAHLDDEGALRGKKWDRWYQYVMFKRDFEARAHWVEATRLRRG